MRSKRCACAVFLVSPANADLDGGIDRKLRRAAASVHGKDVDDRARRLALAQVIDEPLHEKERSSRVDRKQTVPEFHVRFSERSPVRKRRGIDQAVDMAEALLRRVENQIRRIGLFEVRRHEKDGRPASLDLSRGGRRLCPRLVLSPRDLQRQRGRPLGRSPGPRPGLTR